MNTFSTPPLATCEPQKKDLRFPLFFVSVLFISLGYLLFEFFYIPFEVLSADELVFARHIYEYTFHLPYRDFAPYKSVLGHYFLTLPMFFSQALFDPLFYIKDEIALTNTLCIGLMCYAGTTLFDKRAILLTVLALLANQYFLIYSTDLRVDMLASWCCLFSILLLLKKRIQLSGFLMGAAFIISQKAVWYLFAINGSALLCLSLFKTPAYSLRSLVTFNVYACLSILIYLSCWSLFSTPSIVLHNFFYDAYIQAGIDYYLPLYFICWAVVLLHGPLLFLYWPLTFVSLFEKRLPNAALERRVFITCMASIALLLFIHYKQPFPYNFVFTVPAFYFLYAEFFSWLFTERQHTRLYYFAFPLFISAGILYPFYISLRASFVFDGHYQQAMTQLAAALTENDGDYVGGMPFIYKKEQPVLGMKNLIGPQLEYLYAPSAQMETLLLPSLYLAPTTSQQVLHDFEQSNVKVIINNYRMRALPTPILTYINNHYQHFYGSLYLYAPVIHSSQFNFNLKFAGQYRITAKTKTLIRIDGKRMHAGQIIHLSKGDHLSDAKKDYRLVLVPTLSQPLNPAYSADDWPKMIKAIVA